MSDDYTLVLITEFFNDEGEVISTHSKPKNICLEGCSDVRARDEFLFGILHSHQDELIKDILGNNHYFDGDVVTHMTAQDNKIAKLERQYTDGGLVYEDAQILNPTWEETYDHDNDAVELHEESYSVSEALNRR